MEQVMKDFYAALDIKDYAHAERLIQNHMALLGESALGFHALGLLFLAQDRNPEALMHFDKAVELDPHAIEPLLNGIILLADLGFYVESAFRFESAIFMETKRTPDELMLTRENPLHVLPRSLKNDIIEKHLATSWAYSQAGEYSLAAEELLRALQVMEWAHIRLNLARVYLYQGRPEKALEELELAKRTDARNPRIHLLQALAELMLKDVESAMRALARAEVLDDKSKLRQALKQYTMRPHLQES